MIPSIDQKPLSSDERARLQLWHRNMMIFYSCAMTLLTAALFILPRTQDMPWVPRIILAILIFLIGVGAYVQFRERCPRCNMRIGRQSRFMLPKQCRSCGAPFLDDKP